MASKQNQCEICCNENAVGYCQTCGYVGETCANIHKTGKIFQTHTVIMHEAVKMHEDGTENPKVILRDITEERCKQHPTEKAIFLCNIHDSVICGRCLHSEHLSCGKEVVDLLHEVDYIECEKVNTMKSVLKEVKDEIRFLKDETEQSKESCKKNADIYVQKCMELGNKIKRRVDELTIDIIHGISKTNDKNVSTHSRITQTCNEKTKWCENEENKIDDFFDNNMAGHLYLMHRHFEKKVSDARCHLKEIKHKHTFNGVDFKENKVILKCLFEDLEEVCEQQEEVTGSDDGSLNDVVASTTTLNKTRRELTALLNQIKQDSEKDRKALCDELQRVKQYLDNSETKRKGLEQELMIAKQGMKEAKKERKALCDELQRVKQYLDNSETKRKGLEQDLMIAKQGMKEAKKEKAILRAKFPHTNEDFSWTQPTGTVEVKTAGPLITLDFQFLYRIKRTRRPPPGAPDSGCKNFKGRLRCDPEGQMLCRMLKAAFRRGLMFVSGKDENAVLDGVSLYDGSVFAFGGWKTSSYVEYIHTLKAELSVKGITEANIDQTEELYETLTVDGQRILDASLSS